ncbi:DnaB-like helicase C-terminal domain-containing protein [Campylobacter hyointestinalis]|uniref:DnaB-like helicase C-terminal domain-containing protein n=1 Tax=Campylobacter hyointestinalis TaxID=198 RepID=UPI000CE4D9C0|nr:DnaB-like helicase C-terminal domain-containing protein [Campylobacter hyointestinalis]PPB55991.1 topoisomerase [Campylobacter hyointestinalis subsp. hyointestinalis]PPB61434.1 topoisomerase [Campylobacter hyointestinalis subsp. hyointestinalis]
MEEKDGHFLYHTECLECGSSDALAIYDDGSGYCFACNHYTANIDGGKEYKPKAKVKGDFISGNIQALNARSIDRTTCQKWSYECGKDEKGNACQIANYYDVLGNLKAQKIRYPNKSFKFIGSNKLLYGEWLWSAEANGKQLIIVEGEIDALSVSQVYNHKRPVVSIPNGAQGAKKALANRLDWLLQFESIILAFDNDEPGRKAMQECVKLFKPGVVKICTWSNGKDANEILKSENGEVSIHNDIKASKVWRPDGIINGAELSLDELTKPIENGITYPYKELQEKTYGSRGGELIIWTAGSGIGKSTILRELAYHFITSDKNAKVGMIFLEENSTKTAQAFIALDNNIPLSRLRQDPDCISKEAWEASKAKLFDSGRVVFYKHFGSLDSSVLLDNIRYMVVGLGVTNIFLDHISIAISGNDSDNERKDIDVLMTEMRSLVEETGCHIDAVVHLKRTSKGSFNEGTQVSLSDLRGSGGLEQLSDAVIALERNQQAKDDRKNISTLRILKNREIGLVGIAGSLMYDQSTGRLVEISDKDNEELEAVDGASIPF